MSHVRTQIRDAIKTRLTGLTTTADRVFKSRKYPLNNAELPGLCIYAEEEENETDTNEIGTQFRELLVVIEGVDKDKTDIDDALDVIAAEVETAMFSDPFFNNLVQGCQLESTVIETNDDTEQPTGSIAMSFRVNYYTREGAPETAI